VPEPDAEATLQYTCPSCQSRLQASHRDTGKRRKCPHCRQPIKVPGIPRNSRTSLTSAKPTEEAKVGRAVTPTGPKITFDCPQCQSCLLAGPDQVGQSILCEECLETVRVPAMSVSDSTAAVPSEIPEEPAAPEPSPLANAVDPAAEINAQQPPTTENDRTETVIPKSFAVVCAVCGTRLYAHQSQIGSRIPCPDCYATTKVRSPKPVKRKKDTPKPQAASIPVSEAVKLKKTPGQLALEKAEQEVQQQTATIQERESKTRFENLYHFLLQPEILLRLVIFSGLLFLTQSLFLLGAQFMAGIMAILGMLLCVAGFVIGAVTLLLALPTAIIIITETGNGNYQVDGLPGTNIMEFFTQGIYMMICLLALLIPYTVLSHILSPLGTTIGPLLTILLCAAILPVFLLSSLEANAPFIIWSNVIFGSIQENTSCWLQFWKTATLLLVAQCLVEVLLSKIPGLALIVHSILPVVIAFLYCRAVGLLAWETSKQPT